jgi:hypothetical protein
MPLDEDTGNPVARRGAGTRMTRLFFAAVVLAGAGCGPKVRMDDEPVAERATGRGRTDAAPARAVLLGEMCPDGAAGRPGIAPLLVRAVGWTDDADDVATQLERAARRFAVFGLAGARAGLFEVLGTADVGLPQDIAMGSYVGRGTCTPEGGDQPDAACEKATRGCGLAVASIEPGAAEREDEIPAPTVGTACLSGDALLVDVDGDGATESFPVAQFVDGLRAPAEEVLASPVVGVACDGRFTLHGLEVTAPEDPGVAVDPRYTVTLDVMGVLDLDGDGRREVALAFRYPEGRTVALYSALAVAGRLELVGEAVPWQ